MSSYIIPNVGTMTSSALTAQQMSGLWQTLVLQCLGITPSGPSDPIAYGAVRITWGPTEQPAFLESEDIAFIRAVEIADSYNFSHERQPITTTGNNYMQIVKYTRTWEIGLTFYGPNAFDRARQVKSCLYETFALQTLGAQNIYPIPTLGTPRRIRELFASTWFPRTDFAIKVNEFVTETLTKQAQTSTEIIIQSASGIQSDIIIN